jgi:glycosyltransferase involved in cell wall biosynthesis
MRVLHVIDSLPFAGVEVLLTELAPRLVERGFDASVALLKSLDSPLERRLRATGVHFLPTPDFGIYSARHVFRLAPYFQHYDLVHAYLFPAQLWVAMAATVARTHVPLVTSEQGTRNRRRRLWWRPLDRWMYRQYRSIICASEGIAASLRQWLPETTPRLCVVHNGIPLEQFERASKPERRSVLGCDCENALVFVARFDAAKDHPTLLRALAGVPNAHLTLVGDGDQRPVIERMIAELGLAGRVHLLGRRGDVAQVLKACDLYVHCSNHEGFGIAAVEAMAAGLPVIASDVPGLAEVVEGGGLLVPPGDAPALQSAIEELLQSRERRAAVADACRRKARAFSIDETATRFAATYREVLGCAGASAAGCP